MASRSEVHPIAGAADVVKVRQVARSWALELKLSLVDQTKLVTAASELARNTLDHGHGGTMRVEQVENGLRRGIKLTFEDKGPGIPDIAMALRDGYTTSGGLGLGLSGSRRLVNEFDIKSEVGRGTIVAITRWK